MKIKLTSTSMITHDDLQRIEVDYYAQMVHHLNVLLLDCNRIVAQGISLHLASGEGRTYFYMKALEADKRLIAKFLDSDGVEVYTTVFDYKAPIKRTIYTMISSHTDIGLHNSQYIQRRNCSEFIDKAAELCDNTADRDSLDRYRYTIEGTWFWNNYGADRGEDAAKSVINKYINSGHIGICAGVAGNHTQVFGLEEMCRSAYEKMRLFDKWNIKSDTMTMIDNNGMSMSLIGPYAEAGYKNIIFSPNQWNPIPSSIWKMDTTKNGYIWNCDAGGGGARIDIRYSSEIPMVFFWEDKNENRLLVWGAPQYENGCAAFGFYSKGNKPLYETEDAMARQLPLLDEKYPYEVWLNVCYSDDQSPDIELTDAIKNWNSKWKWPKIRSLGNPDDLFNILREKYSDIIPVLSGDITGGWYQHPISAPELLAQKFDVDRRLPNAEKWSVIASLLDPEYEYPAEDFRHAWDYLLFNDEHSYGTSGYQGRRVYETWMQHRDWIDKAQRTADYETQRALNNISKHISSDNDSYVVFNPTLLERKELIEQSEGSLLINLPPLGYRRVAKSELKTSAREVKRCDEPPIIENNYYRIQFANNGSIKSIFDKTLNRELLDKQSEFGANEIIYTNDNHKTFLIPEKAEFTIEASEEKIVVKVKTTVKNLGAKIAKAITLPSWEKRIDIENDIVGAKDMINDNRYYRYLYSAFPFDIENAKRICHLNGSIAEYGKDTTGHGTDVYMAANEWCCCENDEFGVGLIMLDSSLVEFGEIHPDKTDFGNLKDGSQMFVYLANDWLQMHCVGGSHLNYRFRYSITSYKGGFEKGGLARLAERIVNPIECISIPKQNGSVQKDSLSFAQINTKMRLLTLKAADDSNGIIGRFYGEDEPIEDVIILGNKASISRNTVDEREYAGGKRDGYITYRIGADEIFLKKKKIEQPNIDNKKPLAIGAFYTGLITEPKAACGEVNGQLYLLWGANRETNLSHYMLFRSENSDFTADASTHIADVLPEDYVVGRYVDTGLKSHTEYFYRVCAVNTDGVCGEMSSVFSGITKE